MEQREKLIELMLKCNVDNELFKCFPDRTKYRQAAEILSDYLIANGVVVLPCRCEECESFSKGMCDNEHVGAMVFRMKREATDFCSYAERKGGDE